MILAQLLHDGSFLATKQSQLKIHLLPFGTKFSDWGASDGYYSQSVNAPMGSRSQRDLHSQQAACYLFSLSFSLLSCAAHRTVLSLTNQLANFARLQAFWRWFPWGARSLQLARRHCSLVADNLDRTALVMWATAGSGGNTEGVGGCCLPMRRVDDTVPAPFSRSLHQQYASVTPESCSPQQNIQNNMLWCRTI